MSPCRVAIGRGAGAGRGGRRCLWETVSGRRSVACVCATVLTNVEDVDVPEGRADAISPWQGVPLHLLAHLLETSVARPISRATTLLEYISMRNKVQHSGPDARRCPIPRQFTIMWPAGESTDVSTYRDLQHLTAQTRPDLPHASCLLSLLRRQSSRSAGEVAFWTFDASAFQSERRLGWCQHPATGDWSQCSRKRRTWCSVASTRASRSKSDRGRLD